MVANLKKSKEREKSHNNIKKQSLIIERTENSHATNRASSNNTKSLIPPGRLDSAKIKSLINSTSTNSIFKNVKGPLTRNKSSTNSLVFINKNDKATKNSFN
jgi:hypothetical protein